MKNSELVTLFSMQHDKLSTRWTSMLRLFYQGMPRDECRRWGEQVCIVNNISTTQLPYGSNDQPIGDISPQQTLIVVLSGWYYFRKFKPGVNESLWWYPFWTAVHPDTVHWFSSTYLGWIFLPSGTLILSPSWGFWLERSVLQMDMKFILLRYSSSPGTPGPAHWPRKESRRAM